MAEDNTIIIPQKRMKLRWKIFWGGMVLFGAMMMFGYAMLLVIADSGDAPCKEDNITVSFRNLTKAPVTLHSLIVGNVTLNPEQAIPAYWNNSNTPDYQLNGLKSQQDTYYHFKVINISNGNIWDKMNIDYSYGQDDLQVTDRLSASVYDMDYCEVAIHIYGATEKSGKKVIFSNAHIKSNLTSPIRIK